MKKWIFGLLAGLFLLPVQAQVIDISGPWMLDFPGGKGMAILQKTGGTPPQYHGQVTIPYPASPSKTLVFNVKMLSAPNYLQPGNNITFEPTTAVAIQFFMMNLSSSGSGVAWVVPGPGADNHLHKLYGVKAPAHR